MSRDTEKYDYLYIPFPRVNGEKHPALKELMRQGQILSIVSFGFVQKGGAPFAAALLIDRDMKMRPNEYKNMDIPAAGLWYPPSFTSSNLYIPAPIQPPPPEENRTDAINLAAKRAASKWGKR